MKPQKAALLLQEMKNPVNLGALIWSEISSNEELCVFKLVCHCKHWLFFVFVLTEIKVKKKVLLFKSTVNLDMPAFKWVKRLCIFVISITGLDFFFSGGFHYISTEPNYYKNWEMNLKVFLSGVILKLCHLFL